MSNKYEGYTSEERIAAAKNILREVTAIVAKIPLDSISSIIADFFTVINAHPNIVAFMSFNPYMKEINVKGDIFEARKEVYKGTLPPACECVDPNHECHCVDSYNALYELVVDAKNAYDVTRNKNYSQMLDWCKDYYSDWFMDEFGESLTLYFKSNFSDSFFENVNAMRMEYELIKSATLTAGNEDELRDIESIREDFEDVALDFMWESGEKYNEELHKYIERAKEKWSVEDWAADGGIEGLIEISEMPAPPVDSCDCSPEEPDPGDKPPTDNISIVSPIILDLDGNGKVDTKPVRDGAYFNIDGAGNRILTGWVGGNDGFLARDLDENGTIDGGHELFGNHSLLENGSKASNGFQALAELDENGDGVVDAQDAGWSSLNVWVDKNSDGKTDKSELLGMEEAGVTGVNVEYKSGNVTDKNGNRHLQNGTFIRDDGTTGAMNDVWFETSPIHTILPGEVDIPADIAELPYIRGWGLMRDLHSAMALDENGDLQALVERYAGETDIAARRSMIDEIMFAWYEIMVGDGALDEHDDIYAKRRLVLYQFFGTPGGIVNIGSGPDIDYAWTKWASWASSRLNFTSHYSDLYDAMLGAWSEKEQNGNFDPSRVTTLLRELYEKSGKEALVDFATDARFASYEFVGKFIPEYYLHGTAMLRSGYQDADFEKVLFTVTESYYKQESIDSVLWYYENREYSAYEPIFSVGSDESENIYGSLGDDLLIGGGGDDGLHGNSGDDILRGDAGDDTISGGAGNDKVYGGTGDDSLHGGYGDDIVIGGEGNDTLRDDNGINILDGGKGEDILDGGRDSTYIWRTGDGNDTITGGGILHMTDVERGDVRIERNSTFLTIEHLITKEVVRVEGRLTEIKFTDDSTVSITDLAELDEIDVYRWKRGDGRLTLGLKTDDRLRLTDVLPNDVTLSLRRNSDYPRRFDLLISIKQSGGTICLSNIYPYDHASLPGEIEFSDGTVWSGNDIMQQPVQVGSSDDMKYLDFSGADVGVNIVCDKYFNTSNTIIGSNRDDHIAGGGGNDILKGGAGGDTYYYSIGDGIDTIDDNSNSRNDTLVFGLGIKPEDLFFKKRPDGKYEINFVGRGGLVTVNSYMNGSTLTPTLEMFVADGLQLENPQLYMDALAEVGLPAGPSVEWSDAQLQIVRELIALYWKKPEQQVESMQVSEKNPSIDDSGIIVGTDRDDFMIFQHGKNIAMGGLGNDTLRGDYSDEGNVFLYRKGDGADFIDGIGDNSKIVFQNLDFSALDFRIVEDDSYGELLEIRVLGTQDAISVVGTFTFDGQKEYMRYPSMRIGSFELAPQNLEQWMDILRSLGKPMGSDGQWSASQKDAIANAVPDLWTDGHEQYQIGGNDGDALSGTGNDDSLFGLGGQDTLDGGRGDDYLHGGAGDDTYIFGRGYGNDTIDALDATIGKNDVLQLEGLTRDDVEFLQMDGKDLVVRIVNTGETITILNGVMDNASRIQNYLFSDGTVLKYSEIEFAEKHGSADDDTLKGTITDSKLYGGDGSDTLISNAGNDYLDGGDGNDYLFGGSGLNILHGGAGDDTIVSHGHDDIYGGEGNDYIEGDSGYKLIWGDGGNDTIHDGDYNGVAFGGDGDDVIYGNGGDDLITGDNGNDILHGGEGNDEIDCGTGNDTVYGNSGNDVIFDSGGDDVYHFSRGDGRDEINEYSGSDRLAFGDGIGMDNLWFSKSGYDLVIDVLGSEDKVSVKDWFYNGKYQVESMTVGDMELVTTQMNQMLQAMAGFGVPAGVDGQWTEEQKDAMAPVLSTFWRPAGS